MTARASVLVFVTLISAGTLAACGARSTSSCNSSNCIGCCQDGACQAGTEPGACGRGGAACAVCSAGTTCSGGICSSSACSAANPSGTCPSGQTCVSGTCTSSNPCSASNPSGTCPSGQTCVSGTCCASAQACGQYCCRSAEVCAGGSCCSAAQACGSECCTSSEVCATETGTGNMVCAAQCTASSQCSGSTNCCSLLLDNTGAPLSYGACIGFQNGEQCLCVGTSECNGFDAGTACAPLTDTSGNPQTGWPYVCKPNDGTGYDGCNGTTTCSGKYCCVQDANANRFCALTCTNSSSCDGGSCQNYDFSHTSCIGPSACGP
jgi:hypothetical protein